MHSSKLKSNSIVNTINNLPEIDRNKLKTVIQLILNYKFLLTDINILLSVINSDTAKYDLDIDEDMSIDEIHEIQIKSDQMSHVHKLCKDILNPELKNILSEYLNYRVEKTKADKKKGVKDNKKPAYDASDQYLLHLGKMIREPDTV